MLLQLVMLNLLQHLLEQIAAQARNDLAPAVGMRDSDPASLMIILRLLSKIA